MIYHNYRRNETECNEEIIFCCIDSMACNHYGDIHRIFDSEQKNVKIDNGQALEFAAKYYNCSREKIKNEVYPKRIVESAGVWDDIEFINHLYEENYFDDYNAIITPDGAVVFDVELMIRVV